MDGIDAGGRGWTRSLPSGMSGTGATLLLVASLLGLNEEPSHRR
jgi:hypothetical protein